MTEKELDHRKKISDVLWDTEERLEACEARAEKLLHQLRQADRQLTEVTKERDRLIKQVYHLVQG